MITWCVAAAAMGGFTTAYHLEDILKLLARLQHACQRPLARYQEVQEGAQVLLLLSPDALLDRTQSMSPVTAYLRAVRE